MKQVSRQIQAEFAQRELARRKLVSFTKRFNPEYDAGWAHEDIARRLEQFSADVAAKKSPRLMILLPPRAGKTELASRNFPAWHLGHYPDHEIIACSYVISLVMEFSKDIKRIIDNPEYTQVFPETQLDPDNRSAETWGIHGRRGKYVAAGVSGGITGKGAHMLLIDDPIKNGEEADSADNREKLWQWYLSTAYTRVSPGGGILVIQTWWHDDDLAGRLQMAMAKADGDEYVDKFVVVKYPAIAEHDEYLNLTTDLIEYEEPKEPHKLLRLKGEALHPARYDLQKLLQIKSQMGNGRWWSALYQQNPVPTDGAYFLKEQFRREPLPIKESCNVYIAFDFAISEKSHNDYTVGVVGLQDENDFMYIADMVRFRSGDAYQIVQAMSSLVLRWSSPSLVVGVEDGQIWRALEAVCNRHFQELRIYPSIQVLRPIHDKQSRARALQGRMQQGKCLFDINAQWYDGARAEMLRFPAGVHDDQVDALAWLAQMVVSKQPPGTSRPRRRIGFKEAFMRRHTTGGRVVSHMTA